MQPNAFKRKSLHFFIIPVFFTLIIFFLPNSTFAQDRLAQDAFCKSKLMGTSSLMTCAASCPGGGQNCTITQTYKASQFSELGQDLDCYRCASTLNCYDLGYIYGFDCMACEANPKKVCVKSTPVVNPLGIGPSSLALPRDSGGNQCWDCVDRPDQCHKTWPGSSWLPACQRVCTGKGYKCEKVGKGADGFDCYQCKYTPPPPEKCSDKGLINKAQCKSCKPPKPACVFAWDWTKEGKECYTCAKVDPPKKKTCEEQKLKTTCKADEVCKPVVAPNGVNCCKCYKKPKTCKDFHLKNQPCKCTEKEILVNTQRLVPDGKGKQKLINCCFCMKNECFPNLNIWDCKKCKAKGGKCMSISRVRGKPSCYRCVMPKKEDEKKETCQSHYLAEKCKANTCKKGEVCRVRNVPFAKDKSLKCAICEPDDKLIDPKACFKAKKWENCAECLKAQMMCKPVRISTNPDKWCADCFEPRTPANCAELKLKEGGCTPKDPCPEGHKCIAAETDPPCHSCAINSATAYCAKYYPKTIAGWRCKTECENKPNRKCVFSASLGTKGGSVYWSCYRCEPYGYCKEEKLISSHECKKCRALGKKCVYITDVKGELCFECKSKVTDSVQCPSGEIPCGQKCPKGTVQADEVKTEMVEMGLSGGSSSLGPVEVKLPKHKCCKCVKKSTDSVVDDLNLQPYGFGTATTDKKKKTCKDLGYDGDFDDCQKVCKGKGPCLRDGRNDDYDTPCWKCKKKGAKKPDTSVSVGSASVGSIELDRTVYPTPFDTADDFSGLSSGELTTPSGRSIFPIHAIGDDLGTGRWLDDDSIDETLGAGDLQVHVRIADPDFDITGVEDGSLSGTCDPQVDSSCPYILIEPVGGSLTIPDQIILGDGSTINNLDGALLIDDIGSNSCTLSSGTIPFIPSSCGPEVEPSSCPYSLQVQPMGAVDTTANSVIVTGWDDPTDDIILGDPQAIMPSTSSLINQSDFPPGVQQIDIPDRLSTPRTQTIVAVQGGMDIGSTEYTVTNEGADRLRVTPSSQTTGRGTEVAGYTAFVDYGALEFDITTLGDPPDHLRDQTFDPDYNTPYLDELTLQFEQALTDDLAVSLTGFYKRKHNLAMQTATGPKKKKTCQDLGYDGDFDDCIKICKKKPGKTCTRDGRNDDYDTPCWKCKGKDDKKEPQTSTLTLDGDRFQVEVDWGEAPQTDDVCSAASDTAVLDKECYYKCKPNEECRDTGLNTGQTWRCYDCFPKSGTTQDCDPTTSTGCPYDQSTTTFDIPSGCDLTTGTGCPDSKVDSIVGDLQPYGTGTTATTPKKKTCKDLGYDGDFDDCQKICKGKGTCTRDGKNDDYDTPCWKCKKKGEKDKPVSSTAPTQETTWSQRGPSPIYKVEDQQIFGSDTVLAGKYGYVGGGFELAPRSSASIPYDITGSNATMGPYNYSRYMQQTGSSGDTYSSYVGDYWGPIYPPSETGDSTGIFRIADPTDTFDPLDGQFFPDEFETGGTSAWSGTSSSSPRVNEAVIGASHQATRDAVVGANFTYRKRENTAWEIPLVDDGQGGSRNIFVDGFESGDTSVWSNTGPGDVVREAGTSNGIFSAPPPVDTRPIIRLPDGRIMRVNTIERTFVIIIIETPFGRLILDKGKKGGASEASFKPESLMVLANVRSKLKFLNQIGISNKYLTSIAELSEALHKSSSSKRMKFDHNGFKNFNAIDILRQIPNADDGSFGKDDDKDLLPSGPIVAVGKTKEGEDALGFYDATGGLVHTVTRKLLKEAPQLITEGLIKAEFFSQIELSRLNKLKDLRAKDFVKKYAEPTSEFVKSKMEAKKKKKKKKKGKVEVPTVPDDPMFHRILTRKEKKKAFNKKAKSMISIGSSISMGGGTLGVGGGKKDKGPTLLDQWGIKRVGFLPKSDPASAWNVFEGNKPNTLVAVIDSGLYMDHEDGPTYVWVNKGEIPDNGVDDDLNGYVDDVNGWNFFDDNNTLTDYNGHGTFIAGIIAAKTNNGVGMAGINPGAVIMPLKVASKDGEADSFNMARAINYAVNNGARVINLSLGGRGISKIEQLAINYAYKHGVFVAVASGNVNENISGHGPASARRTFPVGSLDHDGTRSTISNWGANNGVIAPGESIYSLRSADSFRRKKHKKDTMYYYRMSGTSFSTPIVAGTVSLLLAKNPNLTNLQIEDILLRTADDMHEEGWDAMSGGGVLNATAALKETAKTDLTSKITEIRINKDKKRKKFESLDVYATVRGAFDSYTVEVGKGKRPGNFKQVAGPFKSPADHNWIAQISEKDMKGSSDWVVRLNIKKKDGQETYARVPVKTK